MIYRIHDIPNPWITIIHDIALNYKSISWNLISMIDPVFSHEFARSGAPEAPTGVREILSPMPHASCDFPGFFTQWKEQKLKLLCGLSGLTERWCQRSVLKDCFGKGWDLDAEFCSRHSVDKTFKQVKIETEVRVWWKGEITAGVIYRTCSLVVSSFHVFNQAGFKGKKGKAPRVREAGTECCAT